MSTTGKPASNVTFDDPILGTLTYDASVKSYNAARKLAGGTATYNLSVRPNDTAAPGEEIARLRSDITWFEESFATLIAAAARELWPLWEEDWRQDDEDEIDFAAFARALTLSSANFDADQEAGDFEVFLKDGGLFGGHRINVSVEKRKVVQTDLYG